MAKRLSKTAKSIFVVYLLGIFLKCPKTSFAQKLISKIYPDIHADGEKLIP